MELEKNWYVVHTYSGYENKVKANLEKRVESMGMQDKIFRVIVPEETETIEQANGRKRDVKRKVFPGYVLVELVMTDDSWYVVRNTPGVTGFVGSSGAGSKPTALFPDEVTRILATLGPELENIDYGFEVGDNVILKSGPFKGSSGLIESIDLEHKSAKIKLEMFNGRETLFESDFESIQKL
ncbi:MAG: transcription termination/antitermination protein NusG [Bacilli bacterium]